MLYPVFVHVGDDKHAHGAEVPDFPGCFSAADNWSDLPAQVKEAIELHCEGEDFEIPDPTPMEDLIDHPYYADGTWSCVEIDAGRLDTKKERVNLSITTYALREIDSYATSHGYNRSGFMVQAALKATRKDS